MGTTADGVDRRQLALVGLCLFGLVVAAFLAPVVDPAGAGAAGSGSGGDGSGSGGDGSGSGGDGSGQGTVTPTEVAGESNREEGADSDRREPDDDGGVIGGTDPIPIPGGTAPPVEDGCGVVIDERPTPGAELTVTVYQDLRPAVDTRVWFNDEFAGRTDANGTVTARVPYERRLTVTVESPGSEPCEFFRYPYEEESSDAVDRSTSSETGARPFDQLAATTLSPSQQTTPDSAGENATGSYEVFGNANLTVKGDPYPGSTVQLLADIEGVPMRGANVTVDGERVGRTDDNGSYELTVPDADTAEVRVSRGDYTAGATIDVLHLQASLVPGELLVVPGEPVAVIATRNGEPVENATVALGDRRLGTTGADGRQKFAVPSALDATVTVRTARQRATAPVWPAYGATIGGAVTIFLLGTLTTAVAAVRSGRRTGARVAAGWVALGSIFGAAAVWEWTGIVVASAIVAIPVLYRYRSLLRRGGGSTVGVVAAVLDLVRRFVLGVVRALEIIADRLVAQLRRLAAWAGSLPRSLTALARRLGAWLGSLPGRVVARVRRLSARHLAAVLVALAFVGGATHEWDERGFIVAAGLVVAAFGVFCYLRGDSETQPTTTDRPTAADEPVSTASSSSAPTLRQLWRRLARWVMPQNWRTRTPAEISRAAIDRGLPREPVERLTEAFRDVEYGGQPSADRREQAEQAAETIKAAREDEQ